MFVRILTIVLLLLSSTVMAGTEKVLNIQHWETQNGANVYFVAAKEIPMVQIYVAFAAGSGRDNNKPGLAQLTNAMLNQGSRDLSADQIAQQFDNVGAVFSSSTNRDMGAVSLQSLTDPVYLNPAIDTFAKVIAMPIFPEDAFLRTKNQTLSSIASENQSPKAVASNAFYSLIYGTQPYHSPVIGTQQVINTLTTADLRQFYSQYYVAKNAVVVIVGAVDRAQAESLASKITQNLPAGQAATLLPPATTIVQASRDEAIKFPTEQTTIVMGQVGINYQNPDYFPLIIGNNILGGSIFSSRLFNEVREKRGLAYGVGSGFRMLAANGPFSVFLQTRNDQAKQAIEVTRQTLNNFVQNGPTPSELQRTKNQVINSFPLTIAGNDAIADNLLAIGFYHLPLDYLDTYLTKVNAVTQEQVKTAFQHHVQPNKMITVLVGQ